MKVLSEKGFEESIVEAMNACTQRADEITDEL
jgi:pyrroline-5-carboxylate reductase